VDTTARSGTTSPVSTTWAGTRATGNTRRGTASSEQGDVDNLHDLHIDLHLRLHLLTLAIDKNQKLTYSIGRFV
jgi:hypothetical protein